MEVDIGLIAVVDTNVLVHSLDLFRHFAACLKRPSSISVVIPFVVIAELDKLKTQRSSAGSESRKASRFILEAMHKYCICIQNPTQVINQSPTISNDDAILDCCTYFKSTGANVVLLSDDVNVCLKASSYAIDTVSINQFRGTGADLFSQFSSKYFGIVSSFSQSVSVDLLPYNDDFDEVMQDHSSNKLVMIEEILVDSLKPCLYILFERIFGLQWPDLISIKEPWSIYSIMMLIMNYWKDLFFTEHLPYYCKDSINRLVVISKDIARLNDMGLTSMTLGDLSYFIKNVIPFLNICTMAGLPEYGKEAARRLNAIQDGIQAS